MGLFHSHVPHKHGGHKHGAHAHKNLDPDHLYGHHHHGSSHSEIAPPNNGPGFAIGTALNLGFVGVELVAGFSTHSLALLADAGHNASDVLGLLLAWGAARLSLMAPRGRFTYGFGSASILAALANALLLLLAAGAISVEAISRFSAPASPNGLLVMGVAAIGVVINLGTAYALHRPGDHDLNVRGAFLHMMADALVSAMVIVSGALIYFTDWNWIDPVASLLVAALIIWGSWGLMLESVEGALGAAPRHVDMAKVKDFLSGLAGVGGIHDLHIWPLSTRDTALSAHLVMPDGHPGDVWLADICAQLEHDFGVSHATIQIEIGQPGEDNSPFDADHLRHG